MNRLTSGMVPLFALLLALGCSGDPTEPLRAGISRIEATPSQLFLQLGESKTVEVTAVDDQGNAISSTYEATEVGAGISVRRDSTFLPVFVNDSQLSVPAEAPTMRFVVTADNYGATTFKLGTGETTVTIPVQVIASTVLDAQISNLTPALGEVVTITAPAGISFTDTSTITFTGAPTQPAEVTVAADHKSITFLPPPNILNAQATIGFVVSDASPAQVFSPNTAGRITTPEVATFPGTISNLAPAVNEPVTVTLTGATFDPARRCSSARTLPGGHEHRRYHADVRAGACLGRVAHDQRCHPRRAAAVLAVAAVRRDRHDHGGEHLPRCGRH